MDDGSEKKKAKETKKCVIKRRLIPLSGNDNKRINTFDKVTTFPQETSTVKVYENEMLSALNAKETLKNIKSRV